MKTIPFLKLRNEAEINYEFNELNNELLPVVFVNGSIFNYKQWNYAFIPAFKKLTNSKRSYLLYDYQGIGLSSFKKDNFSMPELAEELKQILDQLHLDKVHLFGASKGTMVSQAFAGTYPDQVASLSGYGVVNMLSTEEELSSTKQDFMDRLEALQPFKSKFNERMDKKTYNEIMKEVYVPAMFFKPYSQLSIKQKIIAKIVARRVFPMLDKSPIGTMDLLFRYYVNDLINEKPYFEKIIPNLTKIPDILWLNGTIDRTTPLPLVEKLVKVLPNSSLIEFENYGHIDPALTKKKAYNIMDSYVTFLNKQPK